MYDLLLPGSLIFYVIGIFLAAAGLLYRADAARNGAVAAFGAAWLLHGTALVQYGMAAGRVPLANLAEFLLVFGWVILTIYLIVWLRFQVHAAGLALPPAASVCAVAAMELLDSARSDAAGGAEAHPGLFQFHIGISTVGLGVLILALAMSVIYLVQDRALKGKRAGGLLDRLPSLQACDRIGYASLWLGFVALSLGIGTGVLVNADLNHRLVALDLKQVMPLLAWSIFAVILVSRLAFGIRGRKSAYMTIAGVAVGLLAVAGINI
ncbi:hypothetical protein ABI59_04290 [Acidobacteria bacterium Mor1]|nr:hypothetical protein ABI59_04290 [Acidobacteria bacterium Mor1]